MNKKWIKNIDGFHGFWHIAFAFVHRERKALKVKST